MQGRTRTDPAKFPSHWKSAACSSKEPWLPVLPTTQNIPGSSLMPHDPSRWAQGPFPMVFLLSIPLADEGIELQQLVWGFYECLTIIQFLQPIFFCVSCLLLHSYHPTTCFYSRAVHTGLEKKRQSRSISIFDLSFRVASNSQNI